MIEFLPGVKQSTEKHRDMYSESWAKTKPSLGPKSGIIIIYSKNESIEYGIFFCSIN